MGKGTLVLLDEIRRTPVLTNLPKLVHHVLAEGYPKKRSMKVTDPPSNIRVGLDKPAAIVFCRVKKTNKCKKFAKNSESCKRNKKFQAQNTWLVFQPI